MITTDLTCPRGAAKRIELSVKTAAGADENITGWTVVLEFLAAWSSTPLASVSATITDGPAGECYATLTSAQTNVAPGKYVWTMSRTDSGSEDVLASGQFRVLSPEVAGV